MSNPFPSSLLSYPFLILPHFSLLPYSSSLLSPPLLSLPHFTCLPSSALVTFLPHPLPLPSIIFPHSTLLSPSLLSPTCSILSLSSLILHHFLSFSIIFLLHPLLYHIPPSPSSTISLHRLPPHLTLHHRVRESVNHVT